MSKYQNKSKRSGMKKMRNNFLYKTYSKMPLWGKVVLPVAVVVLSIMLVNTLMSTFKIILGVALLGGLVYVISSAWTFFQDQKKKSGRL